MSTPPPVTRLRYCLAALTLLAVAGCGGGDFAELFVKLITARFVRRPRRPSRQARVATFSSR